MKILAIDSSGLVASVAVLVDDILVGEYTINNKKTHSQTLLPMLETMLQMADIDISEMNAVAVASGPGSFTGLRIGAATAKGLAGALHIPIIPVPTLEALAYNHVQIEGVVCPLMDARRQQVYFGVYEFHHEEMKVLEPQNAAPIETLINRVNEIGKPVTFLGDGVPVFEEVLTRDIQVPFYFALAHNRMQRAGSVATLGARYLKEEKAVEAAEFSPVYLRLSQAERERLERKKTGQ